MVYGFWFQLWKDASKYYGYFGRIQIESYDDKNATLPFALHFPATLFDINEKQ